MTYKIVDEYTRKCWCRMECMNEIDINCVNEDIVYKSLKDGLYYVFLQHYDCSCLAKVVENR